MIYSIIIIWYKIAGPPYVLLYRSKLNVAILRAFGANIGKNVMIVPSLTLSSVKYSKGYHNLTVGDNCIIGGNIFLDLSEHITLEEGATLGPGVIIMTHNTYNKNEFLEKKLAHTCGRAPVVIKKGAGIKAGALLIHGVTVGENAVVAGNAVVNRDVPPNTFVAGIPAKIIRNIT